jgi:hypothetical protein
MNLAFLKIPAISRADSISRKTHSQAGNSLFEALESRRS